MRIAALLAAAVALAACDPAPPHWHVSGGHLRDPDGRAVILRGVNLSNAQKTSPYLDTSSADDWTRLRRDFGFNAVRFVITWSAIEPERGQYDEGYLDQVAQRMAWASDAGLSVILDMHEDVYGEGFGFDGAPRWTCDAARYAAFQRTEPWFANNFDPNVLACVDQLYQDGEMQARFVSAWEHVAARLHDAPAIIGFDVLNEPMWGTHAVGSYERQVLAPLYAKVVAAVRRRAPWVAFLEPGASRNLGIATSLRPFDFPDVVYAPHSYDAMAESGSAFDPARRPAVFDNVTALRDEARQLGAALWIGEYGGVATAPSIADYMDAESDAFAAVAASSMYWAYDRDGGYGLLNPDGTEKSVLTGSLVRPYPERVAGDPDAWRWDPDAATFQLTYEPDAQQALPTELVVPARSYPHGYAVDCGGCDAELLPGALRLHSPPPGSPATVILRPL